MPPLSEIDELRTASASGNLTAVKAIFARWSSKPASEKGEIDCCGAALYGAVRNHHHEVASYLLLMGVPLNMDIVILATRLKSYAALQLLLDHNWDINQPVLKMVLPPPLMYAVKDKDLTEWFLSHGANPNADCGMDITPLSFAVVQASLDTIKLLFDYGGTIADGELLHHAARRQTSDREDVINFLLKMGASVNYVLYPNSYLYRKAFNFGTPLHGAAKVGSYDVVEMFLRKGADPLIRDPRGKIALQYAEYYGYTRVAELLRPLSYPPLANGCRINVVILTAENTQLLIDIQNY
ncbi:MAG: hypothetical protein M1813_009678 [Trichoglossum hirsutum]|nr:MAG: hypothetical protein M1813_009678 [Trichoglossum hirsutum]